MEQDMDVAAVAARTATRDPAGAQVRRLPFEFTGTGGEYFRIWIVNLALTVVTLGIWSAWAKVRRERYFHGCTRLDGSAFEYHGEPLAILRGRLVAVGAYVVLSLVGQFWPLAGVALLLALVAAIPWIVISGRRFQMRMTSWRDVRFGFNGGYWEGVSATLVWPTLASLSLGLLLPLASQRRARFIVANTVFGTQPMGFGADVRAYVVAILQAALFALAVLVVVGALVGVLAAVGDGSGRGVEALLGPMFGVPLTVLAIVAVLAILTAYRTRILNVSVSGIRIGPHRVHADLPLWPAIGLGVSNVALVLLTLGLGYPWAVIRQLRFQVEHTALDAVGDLAGFCAAMAVDTRATGEELGEVFDIDMSL